MVSKQRAAARTRKRTRGKGQETCLHKEDTLTASENSAPCAEVSETGGSHQEGPHRGRDIVLVIGEWKDLELEEERGDRCETQEKPSSRTRLGWRAHVCPQNADAVFISWALLCTHWLNQLTASQRP